MAGTPPKSVPAEYLKAKQKAPAAAVALPGHSSGNPSLSKSLFGIGARQLEGPLNHAPHSLGNLSVVLDFLQLSRERLRKQRQQLRCALRHTSPEGSSTDDDASISGSPRTRSTNMFLKVPTNEHRSLASVGAEAPGVTWMPDLLQPDHADECHGDMGDPTSNTIELERERDMRRMLSIDEPTSSSGGGASSDAELLNEKSVDKVGSPKSLVEAPVQAHTGAEAECSPKIFESQQKALPAASDEQERATPAGDVEENIVKKKRPWWTQRALKQMKRQFYGELQRDSHHSPSSSSMEIHVEFHNSSHGTREDASQRSSLEQSASSCLQTRVLQKNPSLRGKPTKDVGDQALKTSRALKQGVPTSEERLSIDKVGRGVHPVQDKGQQQRHQQNKYTRKVYIFVDNSNILAGYYQYFRMHYPETDDDDDETASSTCSANEGETREVLNSEADHASLAERTSTTAQPRCSEELGAIQPLEATPIPSLTTTNVDADEHGVPSQSSPHNLTQQAVNLPSKTATVKPGGSSGAGSHAIQMARGSEYLPKFRYPLFFQLLERGRPIIKKELVGSSPLHQSLDVAMEYGYEVRILKRVKKLLEGQLGAVPVPMKQLRYPPGQYTNSSVNSIIDNNNNNTSSSVIASTTSSKSNKMATALAKQDKRLVVESVTASAIPSVSTERTACSGESLTAIHPPSSRLAQKSISTVEGPQLSPAFLDGTIAESSPKALVSSANSNSTTPHRGNAVLACTSALSEIGMTLGHSTIFASAELRVLNSQRSVNMLSIASDFAQNDIGNEGKVASGDTIAPLKAATPRTSNATGAKAAEHTTRALQDVLDVNESLLQGLFDLPLECSIDTTGVLSAAVELSADLSAAIDEEPAKKKVEEVKSRKEKKKSRSKISKEILSSMVTIRGEQCVDELLHLKMLETLLDCDPGVMVLATGDGAPSEYGGGGFYDVVKRALDRGWLVEIFSWEDQLSGCYLELVQEYGTHALESWPIGIDHQGATDTSEMSQLHHHRPHLKQDEGHQQQSQPQQQHRVTGSSTKAFRRDNHRPSAHHLSTHHPYHFAQDSRLQRGHHKQRGSIRVVCLDWLGEKFL